MALTNYYVPIVCCAPTDCNPDQGRLEIGYIFQMTLRTMPFDKDTSLSLAKAYS